MQALKFWETFVRFYSAEPRQTLVLVAACLIVGFLVGWIVKR
jgi:hypothetical protein